MWCCPLAGSSASLCFFRAAIYCWLRFFVSTTIVACLMLTIFAISTPYLLVPASASPSPPYYSAPSSNSSTLSISIPSELCHSPLSLVSLLVVPLSTFVQSTFLLVRAIFVLLLSWFRVIISRILSVMGESQNLIIFIGVVTGGLLSSCYCFHCRFAPLYYLKVSSHFAAHSATPP